MGTTPDFTWLFIKMLAGLILVLGLAILFIRVVLPRTRLGRGRGNQWFHLVDRLPIEPNRNLYLVKIIGRYFVLGGTEHSINLITEIAAADGEKIETH